MYRQPSRLCTRLRLGLILFSGCAEGSRAKPCVVPLGSWRTQRQRLGSNLGLSDIFAVMQVCFLFRYLYAVYMPGLEQSWRKTAT